MIIVKNGSSEGYFNYPIVASTENGDSVVFDRTDTNYPIGIYTDGILYDGGSPILWLTAKELLVLGALGKHFSSTENEDATDLVRKVIEKASE